ncbi:ammonium transporter [Occallatibacter savannae]|uniref:ammonium transporter n=1 Tax=Occallatibacter savannae TaxID=1002691 RepID=UPI000D69FEF8|nr:ammonium transporter [Occallatibacter savannae]
MTPLAPVPYPETSFALTLVLLLLAPMAIAGLALVNVGLGRSRSAMQSALGTLVVISTAVIAFVLAGWAIASGGDKDLVLHAAGKAWDWAGAGRLFGAGLASAPARDQLMLLFEVLSVAMVAMIPWGSGADRLRLPAGAGIAAVLGAAVFPLAAHWAWSGWLAQLGTNFSMAGGFADGGGAGPIHMLGGLAALAVIWIAGPRKGKFPREGLSTAMPGHNVVYVLFGSLVALVGWLAWNMAGALLWLNAAPSKLVVVAINTVLAATAALVATFSVTRVRFGKPDASLCANGWLAGLVTSSACAGVVPPLAALFVGLVAGIVTPLMVESFELVLSIDDPSGAVSVHGAAGLWGLIAAGVFAPAAGQAAAQLVGVSTLLGLMLPVVYGLFWLLDWVIAFRVDADGERLGMDLHELGGNAYPEFVVHRDESYR